MGDFEIKRGLSTSLFNEDGSIKLPPEKLIDGCWYLTTDTAEVYVAFQQADGSFELKKINDNEIDSFDPKVYFVETYADLANITAETDTLFVVKDENATYRKIGDIAVCVGRDYNDIQLIYGGNSVLD